MTDYKIDLNNQDELHLLSIAVLEKISSLTTEYWDLDAPNTSAVKLDQMSVRRAEYRVLSARLEIAVLIESHKTWNSLSDGSAIDKAKAGVRRAQIKTAKVVFDAEVVSLQDYQTQLKESLDAERAARQAA
tara:strand:- start:300 stop:692 length:393 start_codon:yes stop_codon:yes gene_type:complete